MSFVLSTALLAIRRPNDNFFCAVLSLIVLLAVNLVFGPSLMVAAISFVAASAANALLRLACVVRAWVIRETVIAKIA